MRREKEKNSFSFIKKFHRKQTAVRIAVSLFFLFVVNFFFRQTMYDTLGNSMISAKVYLDNIFTRARSAAEYFSMVFQGTVDNEISKLKIENAKLNWKIKQLENLREENLELQKILQLKDQYNDGIVVAKVATIFINDFARAAVINVGSNNGVCADNIIVNDEGLVGRVIEVHENWSKMLLMTDENFNVPTKIGEQGANAIVTGRNSDVLRLRLVHEDIPLKDRDVVTTSEYGSIFTEKIPIGVVVKKDGKTYIKPYVNFNKIKYVGVIVKNEK